MQATAEPFHATTLLMNIYGINIHSIMNMLLFLFCFTDDIATVKFSPRVPEGDDFCIKRVCLPDKTTVFKEDSEQKCKTAGWGATGK